MDGTSGGGKSADGRLTGSALSGTAGKGKIACGSYDMTRRVRLWRF